MIRLNKIKGTLGLLMLLLICGACEDWLSVSPKSEIKYDDLFSEKNGYKDQLTGVYTALCAEELYGANLTFGAIDAVGQQYYMYGSTAGKYYPLFRFDYEHAQSKKVFEEIWVKMYNAIVNVNILLKGIGEHPGVLTGQEEKIYKGEALGLRAFLHFDLLRMFGKSQISGANEPAIPYVKAISKEVTPLSTVAEVLALAAKDLEEAAALLAVDPLVTGETTTPFIGTRTFRFNYYAVRALLARVYLNQGNKAEALKNAQEVIKSGKFPWVERGKVTTTSRENRDGIFVTEAIFILNNTLLNDHVNKFLRPGMVENQNNVLEFDSDVRDNIFESDRYGSYDWRYNYYFEEKNNCLCSNKLWQYNKMPEDYKNRQPLIRISEMFLIAAECAADKGDAVGYFNQLRRHRGFSENEDLENTISDGAFRIEIGKEYRKEFIGEGQWFFYCKRLDQDNLPDAIVPFEKGYYRFPLPDLEIEYGNRN